MPGSSHRFGAFVLLPGERRLLREGSDVALGPRAFEVLVALVERAGQLVTKDNLLAIVWPRLVVEEANLHVQVSQLRKVIGAEAIVTVPGLGYRFALPLDDRPAPEKAQLRRLSVIVLPFVESGTGPEQDYFADAITDDITTQLSKIKGSYVIGSPTAFAYKRERFDVAAVARELGVRYVLQGRIERSEEGVETNVRLSDAATGAVIWSDVIAFAKEGVINIRREVVARLAMALGLQLVVAEGRRSAADAHPTAIDLVMQAQAAGAAGWSRSTYRGEPAALRAGARDRTRPRCGTVRPCVHLAGLCAGLARTR